MGPLTWILLCLLALVLTAVIIYGIMCLIEPHKHELNHISLRSPPEKDGEEISLKNGDKAVKVLPKALPTADLRLFFFSDVHIETCFIPAETICRHIEEEHRVNPIDAVVFGGDIITWPKNASKGFSYLKKIGDTCRRLDIPFLAVTGNHDTELDDNTASKECGFDLIEGTYKTIKSHAGKTFTLCGVDDSGREMRTWYEMPKCPEGNPVVFIAHDPDAILHTGSSYPEFMLSGHTHGGQVFLPFGLRIAPRHKNILPSSGLLAGTFSYKDTTLFISRGLGCGYLPIRFGSKPEVSVIEFSI